MAILLGVKHMKNINTYSLFDDDAIKTITPLSSQGYCNKNYLIRTEKTQYILREFLRQDIDRPQEYNIHIQAYKKGISSQIYIFTKTFMVSAFLEGIHKSKLNNKDVILLAKTIKKLHSIKTNAAPIDLQIKNKTDAVIRAFNTINSYPKEYVLCHNDLNPQNIFFPNKEIESANHHNIYPVKLIDFEYAGINDRYFDLACVCVEFGLEDEMLEVFLQTYFNDTYYHLEKLNAYKVIYKALCEAWFQDNL